MMVWLGNAWAWLRARTWAMVLLALTLVVVILSIVGRGTSWLRLQAWVAQLKADRANDETQLGEARVQVLDAQRAKLLHRAQEAARARAQVLGQDVVIRQELESEETRIRAMSAEDVAAEMNQLHSDEIDTSPETPSSRRPPHG